MSESENLIVSAFVCPSLRPSFVTDHDVLLLAIVDKHDGIAEKTI